MLRAEVEDREGAAVRVVLDLEVAAGSCLVLAGPSGAGKTTALRLLAGLRRPARGVVTCDDRTWFSSAEGVDLPPERRRVGYVPQDHALFGHLRAWENVAFALGDRPRRARRPEALALLERFGVHARAHARPRELSGGERQRVALARALARRPDALLLDEPLASLDPRARAAAARELTAVVREGGIPVVLVTHLWTEAAQLGDEVAVLDAGRVVQRGTAAALVARPAGAWVADLTGAVVLRGRARRAEGATVVTLDGGGEVRSTDPAEGEVAVSVAPWDVALEPAGAAGSGSAQNRLPGRVASVTPAGPRVRVAVEAAQPLVAEVTPAAVARLGLAPGVPVVAVWKAAATRVVAR